jgi:predicted  nucleic acid-binding Zn-ribbon protein
MGMSDYDIAIKNYQFQVLELCNEIAKLNSHIQTLETTLSAIVATVNYRHYKSRHNESI